MVKKLEVTYNKTADAKVPEKGRSDDFAYDVYVSKGVLVPPLTFQSVEVETDFKTAFDPNLAGLKLSLRGGVARFTPLLISNAPGIIEGSYRDGLKILMRNSFIDSRLVPFAFTVKGKRIEVKDIPKSVLKRAKKFHMEEVKLLDYPPLNEETMEMLYNTKVPAGTVYIEKGDRVAQMHFQEPINAVFEGGELPPSERGTARYGSSGHK